MKSIKNIAIIIMAALFSFSCGSDDEDVMEVSGLKFETTLVKQTDAYSKGTNIYELNTIEQIQDEGAYIHFEFKTDNQCFYNGALIGNWSQNNDEVLIYSTPSVKLTIENNTLVLTEFFAQDYQGETHNITTYYYFTKTESNYESATVIGAYETTYTKAVGTVNEQKETFIFDTKQKLIDNQLYSIFTFNGVSVYNNDSYLGEYYVNCYTVIVRDSEGNTIMKMKVNGQELQYNFTYTTDDDVFVEQYMVFTKMANLKNARVKSVEHSPVLLRNAEPVFYKVIR